VRIVGPDAVAGATAGVAAGAVAEAPAPGVAVAGTAEAGGGAAMSTVLYLDDVRVEERND
jgi:hypothetical protein